MLFGLGLLSVFGWGRGWRLCRPAGSFSLTLSVTLAGEGHNMGVMGEPVECGRGKEGISEDLVPFLGGTVAGEQDRAMLVTFADDLIEILDGLWRERNQAEVVEDQNVHIHKTSLVSGMGSIGASGV